MIIMSPHSNYSLNNIYKHFEGCSDFKFNQNGRFIPYNINIKNDKNNNNNNNNIYYNNMGISSVSPLDRLCTTKF